MVLHRDNDRGYTYTVLVAFITSDDCYIADTVYDTVFANAAVDHCTFTLMYCLSSQTPAALAGVPLTRAHKSPATRAGVPAIHHLSKVISITTTGNVG